MPVLFARLPQIPDGTAGIPVGTPIGIMVEEEGEEPDMSMIEGTCLVLIARVVVVPATGGHAHEAGGGEDVAGSASQPHAKTGMWRGYCLCVVEPQLIWHPS